LVKVRGHTRRKTKKEKPMIGDGKLPNLYWVLWSNDFYICENGLCDWASGKIKIKPKGGSAGPFKTFKEALNYIERNIFISPEPTEEGPNSVFVEDRITGQIWEQSIYAYKKDTLMGPAYNFEIETVDDTKFTREYLEKKGLEFE